MLFLVIFYWGLDTPTRIVNHYPTRNIFKCANIASPAFKFSLNEWVILFQISVYTIITVSSVFTIMGHPMGAPYVHPVGVHIYVSTQLDHLIGFIILIWSNSNVGWSVCYIYMLNIYMNTMIDLPNLTDSFTVRHCTCILINTIILNQNI